MNSTLPLSQRLLIALSFMAAFTVVLFISTKIPLPVQIRYGNMVHAIIAAVVAIILTFVAHKWWSGGTELGLVPTGKTFYNFFMGVLIGGSIALALMWCIGKYADIKLHVNPLFNIFTFASGCLSIFLLSWAEELVFRGYTLSSLQKGAGPWTGLVVVTLGFILYRVVNGWAFQDALFGPGAWGLLFGLAAIRTGGVARSTGMQFAANVVQSVVGTSGFSWLSMNQNLATAQTMAEDLNKAGAWSQFILFVTALLLATWYLRQRKAGKMA